VSAGLRTVLLVVVAAGIAAVLAAEFPAARLPAAGPGRPAPVVGSVADIPVDYLGLYRAAAPTCPGLHWSVLAAVGKVETDHGRSTLPGVQSGANSAGARGPMQFLPATFAAYNHPIPPGGARPPSPYDPHDAVHAAANYLCDSGARDGRDLRRAVFAYNHSWSYVDTVLNQAHTYRTAAGGAP